MAVQNLTGDDGATELELQVTDPACFFVSASEAAACRVTLEHLVHRSDGRLLEYFAIDGASPERIVEMAREASGITDARVVRASTDGGVVRFVVSGPCVTRTMADAGAVTQVVTASEGVGRVVADVPRDADVRAVVETFRDRHPGSELLTSRQAAHSIPVRTDLGLREALAARLTDRQLEVFRTAHLQGYFEWPRASTAEECAAVLDISQPTFSQHIREVQRAVAEGLFEA